MLRHLLAFFRAPRSKAAAQAAVAEASTVPLAEESPDSPDLTNFELAIDGLRLDEAQGILNRRVAAGATPADQSYMRARLATEQGDFAAATHHARHALEARPADLRFMRALAVALTFGPRVEAALNELQGLLDRAPDDLALLHSAALAAKRQARYPQAELFWRRALQRAPDHPQLDAGLAFNLFQQGQYDAQAWMHFVQQIGVNPWHGAPHPPERAWQEQAGVSALRLWYGGGFGDFFQFCRFVPVLHARLPSLALELEVPDSLNELARTVVGVGSVVASGTPLSQAQVHASLLALPSMLGIFQRKEFWKGPYIDAQNAPASNDLPLGGAKRVGIVWRSGRSNSPSAVVRIGHMVRDVPLAPLLRALPGQVTEVVSLQQGAETRAEIDGLPPDLRSRITTHVDCADFSATARALRGVDLLVSVDTSVAHLAGAMGHPVCVLSDFDTYWAWRVFDDVCPWYPRARVLVQQNPDDWAAPLAALGVALESPAR